MKKLKIFKNNSKKYKLITAIFSLALVSSISTGCVSNETETGYYVTYTDNGKELVLTASQYNELMKNNKEVITIRSYGGTITFTKQKLKEATCQKQKPNSLHK